jgi:hypothetical protein
MQQNSTPLQPTPPKSAKRHRSWAIALVVSAVFLLAAVGVAVWLLTKPAGSQIMLIPTGDGSEKVKKVSFVADVPLATYTKRDQNTQTEQHTYYLDAAAGCGVSIHVVPAQASVAPKDTAVGVTKHAQNYGTTTGAVSDAEDAVLKDEGGRSYTFKSFLAEQSVNTPGVPYNSKRLVGLYKQFGQSVASADYWCKADAWEAKKPELQKLVETFIVKTEK